MKPDFETVVRENTPWIMKYLRSKLCRRHVCEDVIQDIWIKAFKAYDSYNEEGKLQGWLMRIAQNTVKSYYMSKDNLYHLSLDINFADEDPLYNYLSDDPTPEEEYLKAELVDEIMNAIQNLPKEQREIITLRYVMGYSVGETSEMCGITEGSVKSRSHYGLKKLRQSFGIGEKRKGEKFMECTEIKKYLFMYALGKTRDKTKEIADHIAACPTCRKVVSALKELVKHIECDESVDFAHLFIHIPEIDAFYLGVRNKIPDVEEANAKLRAANGDISNQPELFRSTWGKVVELKCTFDNDGNELPFRLVGETERHRHYKSDRILKLYEYNWTYFTCTYSESAEDRIFDYKPLEGKDGAFLANACDNFTVSIPMKSMRYQAIPEKAKNIRIRRGNGVLDCGTMKFAYSDRYVCDDDVISLEYTFEMD